MLAAEQVTDYVIAHYYKYWEGFKTILKEPEYSELESIYSKIKKWIDSEWNLRLVQKQLGHSKITTTQVYADVMQPEILSTMNRMA